MGETKATMAPVAAVTSGQPAEAQTGASVLPEPVRVVCNHATACEWWICPHRRKHAPMAPTGKFCTARTVECFMTEWRIRCVPVTE